MKTLLWPFLALPFLLASGAWSQPGYRAGKGPRPAAPAPEDEEEKEKTFARIQEEVDRKNREELERLRASDPEQYARTKEIYDRAKAVEKIVKDFRSGRISEGDARRALTPLEREEMEPLGRETERFVRDLEKTLAFWKAVQKNPEVLVQRQVDYLLGKAESVPVPSFQSE
jgi:hypothetical protein